MLEFLSDEDYAKLQWLLINHPDAGDLIVGGGGMRKIRWGISGRGKRGGARVIDEVGGAAIYPASFFMAISLPESVENALAKIA